MPNILSTVASATPSAESQSPESGPRANDHSGDRPDRFSDVSRREQAQMDKAGEQRSADRDSGDSDDRAGNTGQDREGQSRPEQAANRDDQPSEAVLKKSGNSTPALTAEELKELVEQAESGDMPFSFLSQTVSPGKTGSLDLTVQGLSLGKAMGLSGGQGQGGAMRLMQAMGFASHGAGGQSMERLAMLFSGASGNAAEAGKALDFSAELSSRLPGQTDLSGMNRNQSMAAQNRPAEGMAPLKNYATSVELPVQHAEWGEKVAGKLAWLTSQRMSAAEIHVIPPDMGPLDVRVQVQNDQANVTVHATNTVVRDQLELNSHRLRDMLQDSGLNLEKFEVSADASGGEANAGAGEETSSGQSRAEGLAGTDTESDMDDGVTDGGELDIAWRGELDLYA